MKKRFILSILLTQIITLAALGKNPVINVSAKGETKTLQEARDKARELRSNGSLEDITIILHDEIYPLNETLRFDCRDSSPKGAKTIFRAVPGNNPVISGGVKLTQWEQTELLGGKIWMTKVPWATGDAFFHCLYDGSTRLPRARSKQFRIKGVDTHKYANKLEYRTQFNHHNSTIKPWENLCDIELYGQPTRKWLVNYLGIKSVDVQKQITTLEIPATYTMSGTWQVENCIDHLDQPGEWALNSKEGTLYYYPPSGEPGENIIAPKLNELISIEGITDPTLEGSLEKPVNGIVFDGLTFSYADRAKWSRSDAGLQHDWNMFDKATALVRLRSAEHCDCLLYTSDAADD